jgi:peptidoglycan/xylan/chitin deacetylase (PgdA/CDA1 family)
MVKMPFWVKYIFPQAIMSFLDASGKLFLSFDDGPNPVSTPFILKVLKQYNAKATFFCLGSEVEKYPDLYEQIISEGHTVGNHSYSHLNGCKTSFSTYKNDVEKASRVIQSKLFRPPYGKITPKQYNYLKKNFKIVLWDVMAYDFDLLLQPEQCVQNITNHAKYGSIVVLHDNEKAFLNIEKVLPEILKHYSEKGISFEGLSSLSL